MIVCAAVALLLAVPAMREEDTAALNTAAHIAYARTDADGRFRPMEWLTRGEMAIMLEPLLVAKPETPAVFTDVSEQDA